jgi:hypothetical protein
MNLSDHQKYFILHDGHWYVSKIKQYNEKSINLMAKQLNCLVKLFSLSSDKRLVEKFHRYKTKDLMADADKAIHISDESKLFISIYMLSEDLIDSKQLEQRNKTKFAVFKSIQLEFLEDKNYEFFLEKYTKKFLVDELSVYYRNAKSWLGKYGFYGEYKNGGAYITDAGLEFAKNSDSIERTTALFTYQLKKYQIWNPTIDAKYEKYKIRPYYLLLQIIQALPDNYFTQDEYIIFISKVKSHNQLEIKNCVELISEFRALPPEDKKEYVDQLIFLDKKKNPKAKRTHYESIKDSSAKELDLYTWGNIINQGSDEYVNCYVLNDRPKLEENLKTFSNSVQFIDFDEKLDWIKYLGDLKNISIEDIVEMYLRDGKSADFIRGNFANREDIEKIIDDKLYERDIEEYYFHNIEELDENLVVLSNPVSGRQYPTHIGPIDLLCKDKKTDEYVIVELKRGHTNDEVIGQVLRYMGWVYINLEKTNKRVRGYVVANDFSENIDYSLMGMQSDFSIDLIKPIKHKFTDENRPNNLSK